MQYCRCRYARKDRQRRMCRLAKTRKTGRLSLLTWYGLAGRLTVVLSMISFKFICSLFVLLDQWSQYIQVVGCLVWEDTGSWIYLVSRFQCWFLLLFSHMCCSFLHVHLFNWWSDFTTWEVTTDWAYPIMAELLLFLSNLSDHYLFSLISGYNVFKW